MRYAPPGMCLNDFAVVGDGPYHLLHLQGPWMDDFDAVRMETSYGRASSTDLVHWRAEGPVFGVGMPGRFDDSAVWTMHPFPYQDGMLMAYTGVRRMPYPEQSIGFAASSRIDGTQWRRLAVPHVRPDHRWYRTGPDEAWRDPWVVSAPGEGVEYAMVVAARTAIGPPRQSGCVGFAISSDASTWTVQPPILVPGDIDELECPVVQRLVDGGWLLLGSVNPEHEIRAWRADTLTGYWVALGPIAPPGPYAPRVVRGPNGEQLLLHTVSRRVGLHDDGDACRGMLAQPKLLVVGADRVRLAWWSAGFEPYLGEPIEPDRPVRDAVVEWTVDGETGVVLRDDGGPDSVMVTVGDRTVSAATRSGRLLQQSGLGVEPRRMRALVIGEFIEVYADDELVLSTTSYGSGTGACRIRSSLTTATATATVTVRPVRTDGLARDDVSTLWPGPTVSRRTPS